MYYLMYMNITYCKQRCKKNISSKMCIKIMAKNATQTKTMKIHVGNDLKNI